MIRFARFIEFGDTDELEYLFEISARLDERLELLNRPATRAPTDCLRRF
jgi:hypothetical protein